MDVSVFSPAKVNLFLAITGRRPDGFHDLVSVVAPLDFGDQLKAEIRGQRTEVRGQFTLECDYPGVPVDGSNLVLKAAEAFAEATGWPVRQATGGRQAVHFTLTKRIPMGAGLGGGSSNAVASLRALNQLAGGLLDETRLAALAVALGSDCALFLANQPVVMRGRGDQVERLPDAIAARLRGRRVLLFKPAFGISTPWAYQRMIARGADYLPAAEADPASPRLRRTGSPAERIAEMGAERWVRSWIESQAPAEELLFNNMEPAAFEKYVALPVLREKLQNEFGARMHLSGSGSAGYVLLGDPATGSGLAPSTGSTGSPQAGSGQATSTETVTRMKQRIHEAWGTTAFVQEARLA
jgi:4-diphosphocytidyl-2-C-methyl-D-erythritol kinase